MSVVFRGLEAEYNGGLTVWRGGRKARAMKAFVELMNEIQKV